MMIFISEQPFCLKLMSDFYHSLLVSHLILPISVHSISCFRLLWRVRNLRDINLFILVKNLSRYECLFGVVSPFYFYPLTPKHDQHLISPYNITPELNIRVTS